MSKRQGILSDNSLMADIIANLQLLAFLQKLIQLFTSVIFPIVEGIIINQLTGEQTNETMVTSAFIALFTIVLIHCFLVYIQLSSNLLSPNLILDLDRTTKEKDNIASYQNSLVKVIEAIKLNLIKLDNLDKNISIKDNLEEILKPWIQERKEIFNFRNDSLYSLSIYLFDKRQSKLILKARLCDDRINQRNRSWNVGDGYVGTCYLVGEPVIWPDAALDKTPIVSSRIEDNEYYRAVIAIPIKCNSVVVGVLIVTSSKPEQFDEYLHAKTIVPVLSSIVGGVLLSLNVTHSNQ